MIQGNVSAHASFQTRVLLAFYLQQLPWGGFNVPTPVLLQMGGQEGCALCTTRAWGRGQRTTAVTAVPLSGRGSGMEPTLSSCSMQGSLQQDAGQVNGCRKQSGTSVGQSSMQDKDVAPAWCFPSLRSACQDFSQFAFLKRGCSFKSLISASFSLKT